MTLQPFHLAFPVLDIAKARSFYSEVLGCTEGRSSQAWIDFDFFGNQITCHLAQEIPPSTKSGDVDGIRVPIPHFGVILTDEDFEALKERLNHADISFVIPPRIRYEGDEGQQKTMFFKDPFGNALEIKSFKDHQKIFLKNKWPS